MELLFQILLVLGIVKYCCKAGFFSSWKGIASYALFAGLVAILFYPIIIKMDTNTVSKLLGNKTAVSNIVVLVTFEAISGMMISIGMLHNLFETKKHKWTRILKLTPGILIVGIIFYIELTMFKSMAGMDFLLVASLTSLLLIVGVSTISLALKHFLPTIALRYELKFLINLLLLVFAILLNAGLASYNSSNYSADMEYAKLFVFTGVVLFGFLFGLVLYKNKFYLRKKLKLK